MQKFEIRKSVWIDSNGQKICGMLHQPLNASKTPAVLICHGFAGNKMGKYRIYVTLAEALAKVGISTLRIDFRGCGESEGSFSSMTLEGKVTDALKSLEYLRNDSSIDSERIGILGNSFGAAVAVLAAEKDKKIKSLSLLAALFTSEPWKKRWEVIHNSQSEEAKLELHKILDGNFPGQEFYRQFFSLNIESALQALSKIPLLHIHSEKDDIVSIEQAKLYESFREKAEAQTKWVRLQKCNHDFSIQEEREKIVEEVVLWFQNTL